MTLKNNGITERGFIMLEKIDSKGQRLLSIVLAVMMVISVLPVNTHLLQQTAMGISRFAPSKTLYNVRNDLYGKLHPNERHRFKRSYPRMAAVGLRRQRWNPIGSGDLYGDGAFSR